MQEGSAGRASESMVRTSFCTIVARNYLAFARVLATSLRKHAGGEVQVSVLVLDDEDGEVDCRAEPFDVVRPSDLDIAPREFHHMAAVYDILELATAVKPWLLQHLLSSSDVVCYLDPDIEVFASLAAVGAAAQRHSIVLTPHATTPMPRDGLIPNEQTIRQAGVFNLGFIAVSRDADAFLEWWAVRLRRECRIAVEQGLFVDQRWVDFVPAYFENTVLVDPGYNVAYWNLYERDLKLGADGYEVNGQPLRFFHFSGFDPLRPFTLSKHQVGPPRVRLEDNFHLARLCNRYAAQVLAAGHVDALPLAYRYGFTSHGLPMDHRVRRLYREALEAEEEAPSSGEAVTCLPDPFDPAEADAFAEWLAMPDTSEPVLEISRYLGLAYSERPDLVAQFGKLEPGMEIHVREWMRKHGRDNAGVLPEFVPKPVGSPRAFGLPEGVNLVGYLRAEDGVGAVARSVLDVLDRVGTPVSLRTCVATPSRQSLARTDRSSRTDVTYDVTIACVNADQLPLLALRMGEQMPVASSTVGVWAWEVETFPQWMAWSEKLLDEVWTYSRHAAGAIAAVCDVPVHVFRPPVVVPELASGFERADFGLTDDFTFLFCFDFGSVFERKNPLAVIDAFRRAFSPGEGPRLLIKTVNGSSVPKRWHQLIAAAGDRSDIEVRDGYEPAERQTALMAVCDCYVSLHRAEGYGLTLAEAMAAGKPVIGTGYSGNLDFMTHDTAVLVPYEMQRIPLGCRPYPATGSWASPDVDAASEAMRRLVSDPVAAAALGSRARAHIARLHTSASREEFVRARLDALRSSR